jgi:hypothetical protein
MGVSPSFVVIISMTPAIRSHDAFPDNPHSLNSIGLPLDDGIVVVQAEPIELEHVRG